MKKIYYFVLLIVLGLNVQANTLDRSETVNISNPSYEGLPFCGVDSNRENAAKYVCGNVGKFEIFENSRVVLSSGNQCVMIVFQDGIPYFAKDVATSIIFNVACSNN